MSNGFVGPRRYDPTGRYQSPWGDLRDVASPFADLFGGGSGLAGAAGAGAAAAGGGLPWQLILPIAFSFLQSSGLFGGGGDDFGDMGDQARNIRMLMRQLGIQQPYRSPYLPEMDKTVAQAVLNNLRRYSNFGMPEGMAMDTSFIPDLTEMAGFGRGREKIRR